MHRLGEATALRSAGQGAENTEVTVRSESAFNSDRRLSTLNVDIRLLTAVYYWLSMQILTD